MKDKRTELLAEMEHRIEECKFHLKQVEEIHKLIEELQEEYDGLENT